MTDINPTLVKVIDDLSPEDSAMLQALYSRSPDSVLNHKAKIELTGSSKFMSKFYVNYGHQSIADCGSTTIFIEGVSLLAAKAIQDWPLYSGQETSTRYINMAKQEIKDPLDTSESRQVINEWMNFYKTKQDQVSLIVKENHPIQPTEKPEIYEQAVKARVFDIMRGFLPAGVTTQLSWHTNLRQASDHLMWLDHHPLDEMRNIARRIRQGLDVKYPSSGFAKHSVAITGVKAKNEEEQKEREAWIEKISAEYSYFPFDKKPIWDFAEDDDVVIKDNVYYRGPFNDLLSIRPKGCLLPHFLTSLGTIGFNFLLDFGSFRDLQRHRNGVCLMPTLTTEHGFEPWYLDRLEDIKDEAQKLLDVQAKRIASLSDNAFLKQYYIALGYRVITTVTYGLPAAVYVMEVRSSKTVHPTLRRKVHKMINEFKKHFPDVTIHADMDPNHWDIRRGSQTITERK